MSFWTALAKHYKGSHYSDLIVFEIVRTSLSLSTIQTIGIRSNPRRFRPSAPKTLIGRSWSLRLTGAASIRSQKMAVLPEKNLVYTFHCYDPFFFTHQGAEWIDEIPKNLNSLPFPSSPESVGSDRV